MQPLVTLATSFHGPLLEFIPRDSALGCLTRTGAEAHLLTATLSYCII